ncbi:MAG TPA: peptidylprolyl isomerase [Planctomycetota bacterium]|nr:peptidylprolyl isomerase [Planctomycetota bacterium]
MAEAPAAPVVVMETSEGTVTIELWPEKAPITVKNFLTYVDEKSYDGTIFHRVIPNFMIQGGGFTPEMKQKPTHAPIKNEAKADVQNKRGTLAMARTGVVDSATAQFFINVVDNDFLNHRDETPRGFGYCVFGKVTSGMDVVDKIRKVKTTTRGPYENVPVEPVLIKSMRRE